MPKKSFGDLLAQEVSGRIATPQANAAAIQGIPAANRVDGMLVLKQDDCSTWQFVAASTATDTSGNLVLVPSSGSGAWIRKDTVVTLSLPFTFATADAAVLFTVPTGFRLRPRDLWWEISADMTGGSSSAIGVHCSVSGWSTKGDMLGGATGDVAATLVHTATRMTGTVGTHMTAHTNDRLVMLAADTLNFDQITSAFTAGAGNVRCLCDVLLATG